jgi:hypothetical protein
MLWLFLAVLAVHHPALWIDHVLGDEVSSYKYSLTGDLSEKLASLTAQGTPALFWIFRLSSIFPDANWALRACNLLSLWATALVLFRILSDFAGVRRSLAFTGSIVMIVYPAFQLYAFTGSSTYVICVALFALGTWSYLIGLRNPTRVRPGWLILAAGLWTVSFGMQSLLVYIYATFGAIAVCWLPNAGQLWRRASRAELGLLVRIHILYFLMPPLFYFCQRRMFPLDPVFAGYNVPDWTLGPVVSHGLMSLRTTIAVPFAMSLHPSALTLCLAFVSAVVACSALTGDADGVTPKAVYASSGNLYLIAAGACLLMAGILPYALVNKLPTLSGDQTRFAILVAPSIAVIGCGILQGAAAVRSRIARRFVKGAAIFFVCAFAIQDEYHYADWQACSIKDHAIAAALGEMPAPGVNYLVIHGDNLEHTYNRRWYDWGYILHKAWGGFERIGIEERLLKFGGFQESIPLGMRRDYVESLSNWIGYGCPGPPDDWTDVDIETAPDFDFRGGTPWRVVLRDLYLRIFGAAGARDKWLRHFILRVHIDPPHPYTFDSSRLQLVPLREANARKWQAAASRPMLSATGAAFPISAYLEAGGSFSVLLNGSNGLTLRCDSVVSAEKAPAEIQVAVKIGPRDNVLPAGEAAWGIAVSAARCLIVTEPRLVIILADRTEYEGTWRSSRDDSLEAWCPPGLKSPPVTAWLIWKADWAHERLCIHSIRCGWVAAEGNKLHSVGWVAGHTAPVVR